MKQYPIILLIGGIVSKGLLVLLTYFIKSPALVSALTTFDPGALTFANWGTSLFFDSRGIAPSPGEAHIFEILLVLAFGIECWCIGFVFRWLMQRVGKTRAA